MSYPDDMERAIEHLGAMRLELTELSSRFAGLDLKYRRDEPWPHVWMARLITSKNERAEYRLTAFGPTAEAAVEALYRRVKELDAT